MHAWRRQIGHRHLLAERRGPRPFAVVSYLVRGRLLDDRYVPLRHLTVVALFDEQAPSGELLTRLVGISGHADPIGLCFGGPDQTRFDKNLRLAPCQGRGGARLDTADAEFFEFALSLERYLERCARHPFMPRRRVPRLPTLGTDGDDTGPCLVDVTTLPKRQVIELDSPARDLVGRSGTTTFDFFHTRFRVAG
jgi:hypothetical protein